MDETQGLVQWKELAPVVAVPGVVVQIFFQHELSVCRDTLGLKLIPPVSKGFGALLSMYLEQYMLAIVRSKI